MGNGGKTAQRGFIFQTIIAIIECLERDDWDEIKLEPETELDKVDIVLYKDGEILFAMQVKSSKNFFERWEVIDWLNKLKKDATSAKEIRLYLVGDHFSDACEKYILETPEVKTISFENLQIICTEVLIEYIKKSGIVGDIRRDDLELLDASLFSKIHKNSITEETVTRAAFEKAFRKAMPVHMIPQCLTSIPTVNQEVGLVGRKEVVNSVRSMLEENNCTALVSGIGGIGKTAVMRHICNDLKNEGKYVAWIDCGDSLQDDLLILRTALGIPETDDMNTAYAKIIDEIRSRLTGRLYLFMDNLSRFLTENEQGVLNGLGIHVMITSRFKHKYFTIMILDTLEKQSAIDMFYAYYKLDLERKYEDIAWSIIDSVHSHTLLVELLAKAAWDEGGTLEHFFGILQEKGFFEVSNQELSTEHDKTERTIEACVTKLYEISDLPDIHRNIMRLFTIFTPEKEIYFKVREWGGLDRQGMRRLVELGWLNRGGLENGYHIHSIIRDSLSRQMKMHGEVVRLEDYDNLLKRVQNTNNYLSGAISYELVRERIVLPEDICRYLLERVKIWSVIYRLAGTIPREYEGSDNAKLFLETGELLNGLANVYCAQGYYKKALNCCDECLAICEIVESLSGMECVLTAQVYAIKALLCFEQDSYENALKNYKKALAIIEHLYGTENISVSALYNNISGVYLAQGNYEKAKEYMEKGIIIAEKSISTDYIDMASIYNNMANEFLSDGNLEKAEEYYKKALDIEKSALEKMDPKIAVTLGNLANLYASQEDYNKSLEYYGNAIEINKYALSEDHLKTAYLYDEKGNTYYKKGDYDKALDCYFQALTIYEQILGQTHRKNANIYHNIAGVYFELREYDKALEYNKKALAIREHDYGVDNPITASTYFNMASTFYEKGDYDKALEYYEKVLSIREHILGKDNSETAIINFYIANIYRKKDCLEKALEYYGKSLATYERVLGQNHPDTYKLYGIMALTYYDQGDYVNALKYYGKLLYIQEEILSENHYDIAITCNNMAGVFYKKGDYENAIEYYGKAIELVKHLKGMDNLELASWYNNMAFVLREQGKYDNALELYKKANAIFLSACGKNHPYVEDTQINIMIMETLITTGMTEDELMEMYYQNFGMDE